MDYKNTKMKEVTIQIPNGKKAEWVNGVPVLVDEPKVDNRPVTERIKTFEDAMEALGQGNNHVEEYIAVRDKLHTDAGDLIAYLKLRIIVAALNDGWKPQFTTDECRYYPWFYLYTKEKYDELSDEEKGRCVLRSGHHTSACAFGGFMSVTAYFGASSSFTSRGSRLAFKTRELADYAGRQFAEEYVDFMFKPDKKEK